MRGGIARLTANPSAARTLLCSSSSSTAASAAYSTFSGGGGGGRGRGRGSSPPPPHRLAVPGQQDADADEEGDLFASRPGLGHGRGQPVHPSSPILPSFTSWISSSGRGRGGSIGPPPPPDSNTKKPIFFKRDDDSSPSPSQPKHQFLDPDVSASPLPQAVSPLLPGTGRGKPTRSGEPTARPAEENRHLRRRQPPIGAGVEPGTKMGREEAVRRAVEVLSRGGPSGPVGTRGRGRGRGGRGMARGRGRGGRFGDRRGDESAEGLYLGDNADGERLEKRLGEEKMKVLTDAFEETSWTSLPSPMEDAYLDALHTNNMIEYEPEYLVNFDNPDIDEKPPMSLRDALEKAKPFLIAYEGIKSQEEWEEAIEETMEKAPYMKELMDMYCGPDRVTAKEQQQELQRVANTLPENIPSSVRRFTDRALLSLQSNPGWGFDKKCQFMDKLVWEVSQQYK
ncbi:uncharacterized protein [Typha latifolia]|uniref:uncharacterized protein n=1 Tax=Typha latifolia TaxID=4733 RepID=UPI003C30A0D6